MLKTTFHKLKMRLAAFAPSIFGAESSLLQKLSASALLKSNKASALSKEQEKCQKCQEIIDRCFSPAEPINYKENFTHILASTDVPKDPPTDKLKESIIKQVFSDDLTKNAGDVGKIELAASNREDEEKLITKIETLQETSYIQTEATLRDTVHSNVFGGRLSEYSFKQTTIHDEFDDLAKRSLKNRQHDLDSELLREIDRIAVPLFQRREEEYPSLQKEKSIFETYYNPDANTDRDAREALRNLKTKGIGPPFETLLVREPAIFPDDREAPTFQTNTSTPQHFFQEPLLMQEAPKVSEILQATHHCAASLDPKFKPAVVEVEDSFFDDDLAYEYEPRIQNKRIKETLPEEESNAFSTTSKVIDLATFSEAPKFKEHEIVNAETEPVVKELPKNVEADQFGAAAKPAEEHAIWNAETAPESRELPENAEANKFDAAVKPAEEHELVNADTAPEVKELPKNFEDNQFDGAAKPAEEHEVVNAETAPEVRELPKSVEGNKFSAAAKPAEEHEIVNAETATKERDLPKYVEPDHIFAAAKPTTDPMETIQPQTDSMKPLVKPTNAATKPQEKPMEEEPSPEKAQPLNEKSLTLKQLLERIRQKNKMDYRPSSSTNEGTAPEASYPFQNPPSCPMPPSCPGGKPMCVPPCGTPAGPCPGPGSKPQCIPPCEMPAGPCPTPRQKPSGSKCESTRLNPFFKDLVLMLIQVGLVAGPRPEFSRIFTSFLYNINAFAKLRNDFAPSKLNARDYEPWSPIPSWPIPKSEKKQPFVCPKEGCKLIPPPKLHPPCLENPCKNLPIPGTYPLSFSCNRIYNIGVF